MGKHTVKKAQSGRDVVKILFAIFGALMILYVAPRIWRTAVSVIENHKVYEAMINFTPTETSTIEVTRYEPKEVSSENTIVLDTVEAQEAAMATLSQLEYDGYYLWPIDIIAYRERSIDIEDLTQPRYELKLRTQDNGGLVAVVCASLEFPHDRLGGYYYLKYANVEPAIQYCDQLFGIEPTQ